MNMLMKAAFASLLVSAASACAESVEESSEKAQQLTAGVPVSLYFAEGRSDCVERDPNTGACSNLLAKSWVRGYVEVENIAYEKQVFVHYESADGTWVDAPATYAGPTTGGKEAWFFETEAKTHAPRLGAVFPFAIRYEVGGETYWDNNGGENYLVGGGARTLAPTRLFESGAVDLSLATLTPDGRFSGTVDVKNIDYDKSVDVVYSTDGWQTVEVLEGEYLFYSGDWERWRFETELGSSTDLVEFAISYEVGGQVHWDNGFGEDYRLEEGTKLD